MPLAHGWPPKLLANFFDTPSHSNSLTHVLLCRWGTKLQPPPPPDRNFQKFPQCTNFKMISASLGSCTLVVTPTPFRTIFGRPLVVFCHLGAVPPPPPPRLPPAIPHSVQVCVRACRCCCPSLPCSLCHQVSTENSASLLGGLKALRYLLLRMGHSELKSALKSTERLIGGLQSFLRKAYDKNAGYFRTGGRPTRACAVSPLFFALPPLTAPTHWIGCGRGHPAAQFPTLVSHFPHSFCTVFILLLTLPTRCETSHSESVAPTLHALPRLQSALPLLSVHCMHRPPPPHAALPERAAPGTFGSQWPPSQRTGCARHAMATLAMHCPQPLSNSYRGPV